MNIELRATDKLESGETFQGPDGTTYIGIGGRAIEFEPVAMPTAPALRDMNSTGVKEVRSRQPGGNGRSPPPSNLDDQTKPCVATPEKPCPSTTGNAASGADQNQNQNQNQQQGGLDSSMAQQAERDMQACRDQVAKTKKCCMNPIACKTSGGVQDAYNTLSALATAGGAVMIGTAGNDPKKLQQACSIMQAVGYGSGATNAGLAAVCYTEISSCEDTCGKIKTQYQAYVRDSCPEGVACASTVKSRIQSTISSAQSAVYSCESMNGQVQAMATQAVAGGLSGAFGGLCANISTASTDYPTTQPVFNTDCNNPANAGNPICLNCSLASNATNPLCKKAGSQGLGDGSGVSLSGNPNFGAGSASQNNVAANAGFDGNGQKDVTGGGQFKPASSGGVPNAPGQMLGSGGGGGAFGGPDRPQGGRGAGYNTDVLQGTGGGGGYTVSSAPVAGGGGGFAGYGQQEEKRGGKPFDLRNYLPGGTKDPKRNIAGIGNPSPEIGNKFVDIFQRVHDRYAVLCRLERMLECAKKK